jgi:hypothetical protein
LFAHDAPQVAIQPHVHPALLRLSAKASQYFMITKVGQFKGTCETLALCLTP